MFLSNRYVHTVHQKEKRVTVKIIIFCIWELEEVVKQFHNIWYQITFYSKPFGHLIELKYLKNFLHALKTYVYVNRGYVFKKTNI